MSDLYQVWTPLCTYVPQWQLLTWAQRVLMVLMSFCLSAGSVICLYLEFRCSIVAFLEGSSSTCAYHTQHTHITHRQAHKSRRLNLIKTHSSSSVQDRSSFNLIMWTHTRTHAPHRQQSIFKVEFQNEILEHLNGSHNVLSIQLHKAAHTDV